MKNILLLLMIMFMPSAAGIVADGVPGRATTSAVGHFSLIVSLNCAETGAALEGAHIRHVGDELENAVQAFLKEGASSRADQIRRPALSDQSGIAVLGLVFTRGTYEEAKRFDPKLCKIEVSCAGFESRLFRLGEMKVEELERSDKRDSRVFALSVALEKAGKK